MATGETGFNDVRRLAELLVTGYRRTASRSLSQTYPLLERGWWPAWSKHLNVLTWVEGGSCDTTQRR
jgi:hypothetical protein